MKKRIGWFSRELDNKGQAEAVFRLMIDSVIGLAILVIIMASIYSFDRLTLDQSISDFKNNIINSVQSPDGTVFGNKDLTFAEGYAITTFTLQNWTQKSYKCFDFDTATVSVKISSTENDAKRADFTQRLTLKVYSKCISDSCDPVDQTNPDNCCVRCVVSFGRQPK